MTELISTRESAYVFTAAAVLIVLVLLLVFQTYRSRQISRATMNVVIGAIVTGVAVVVLLFLQYAVPYQNVEKIVVEKRKTEDLEFVRDRDRIRETTVPRNYVCYRTEHPVNVDGSLTDRAWIEVPWTEYFVDITGETLTPRYRTRAKMMWDNTYFYLGAELEDRHVWGTLTNKNAIIFHDNDFEVFIDPDADNHNCYELELNALNTIWELTLIRPYRDDGPAVYGTNMEGLRSAVRVTGSLNDPTDADRGWSVEIAFPWTGFRRYTQGALPPGDGEQWRMNLSRVEWQAVVENGSYKKVPDAKEDNWAWSPQGVVDMDRPETWGYVQFSTANMRSVPFSPDPSLTLRKLLMQVYYAQKAYHEQHKRWATSLEELGLGSDVTEGRARIAAMSGGAGGFQATGVIVKHDGKVITLNVNQESRLWTE